jgi:hypothetical protein
MSVVADLEQREKVGNDLIYSFMLGQVGQNLGLPMSLQVQQEAADLFEELFGTPPEAGQMSGTTFVFESGQTGKVKAGSKLWKWLTAQGSAVARAVRKNAGAVLILSGAAAISITGYGAFQWMTEAQRNHAAEIKSKAELLEKMINSKDPAVRAKAIDMVGGLAPDRLPTLAWVSIIAGITVLGLFIWRRN